MDTRILFFMFNLVWKSKGTLVSSVASLGCTELNYIEKHGGRLSGNRNSRFSAG
jgi:hypothetical protein